MKYFSAICGSTGSATCVKPAASISRRKVAWSARISPSSQAASLDSTRPGSRCQSMTTRWPRGWSALRIAARVDRGYSRWWYVSTSRATSTVFSTRPLDLAQKATFVSFSSVTRRSASARSASAGSTAATAPRAPTARDRGGRRMPVPAPTSATADDSRSPAYRCTAATISSVAAAMSRSAASSKSPPPRFSGPAKVFWTWSTVRSPEASKAPLRPSR
mmetsp:Transcript_16794/g.50152  ORF Transcript_16794/g.50152 Transcript_16794/m.50152 type:complete len:218 (-) Transcript_16794:629-1282(-)